MVQNLCIFKAVQNVMQFAFHFIFIKGEQTKVKRSCKDPVGICLDIWKEIRVQDCELQLWSTDIQDMPKLRLYSKFKMTREELYLSLSLPRRLSPNLAHYRTSSHCLEIEVGRHHNVAPEDRLCKLCGEGNIVAVEGVYHVLFHCPTYEFLRTVYIGNKDIGLPNEYNFIKYLQTEDQETLIDLANFISSMFKTRHQKFEMRMS